MGPKINAFEQQEPHVPRKDHFWACAVCLLLGTVFFLPFHVVITVQDYYYVLFPHYHPSRVFTLIYFPIALVFTVAFTWHEARTSSRMRVLLGFGGFLTVLLSMILVDLATTGHGSVGAYIALCFIMTALGVFDGVAQGALLGDLSYMKLIYFQAFIAGVAMAGLTASVLRMITKAAFGSSHSGLRKGALTFFAITSFAQGAAFLLYAFVFPRLQGVKDYRLRALQQGSCTVARDLAAAGIHTDLKDAETGESVLRLSISQLCAQNWDYAVDLLVLYLVSLSIFPGFLYEDTGHHKLGSWYSLVLVTVYNLADLISRYFPLVYLWDSREGLSIACFSRALFIPCFYFAAKYADAGWMIFLCAALGLTGGFLTANVVMVAPRGYNGPEQYALGNILVCGLSIGLATGVVTTWLWLIGTGPRAIRVGKYLGVWIEYWPRHRCCYNLAMANWHWLGPEQYALGNILVCGLSIGLATGVVTTWLWLIGTGPRAIRVGKYLGVWIEYWPRHRCCYNLAMANWHWLGPEQYALGNILVCGLSIGLATGVVTTWLWLIGTGW